MRVERIEPNSHVIRFETKPGWEQWLLLTADHHWDNPHCDRKLLARHLQEAKDRGALVFCFGDLFCLMQGKYDPRHRKADIRPEHMKDNYLDVVIEDAAEWYKDYPLVFVGSGNHETGVARKLESSPIDRFCKALSYMKGENVAQGSYSGWVRFHHRYHTGGRSQSIRLKYNHGAYKSTPKLMASFLEGADILVTGHNHDHESKIYTHEFTDNYDKVRLRNMVSLVTSTYKEEYNGHAGAGYHIEKGRPPKPLGSWWVRLYWSNHDGVKFEWLPCV